MAILLEPGDLERWTEVDSLVGRLGAAYWNGGPGVPPVRFWRKREGPSRPGGRRGGRERERERESWMGRPAGGVERGAAGREGQRESEMRGEGMVGVERGRERERRRGAERLEVGEVGNVGRAVMVDAKSPMRRPVVEGGETTTTKVEEGEGEGSVTSEQAGVQRMEVEG